MRGILSYIVEIRQGKTPQARAYYDRDAERKTSYIHCLLLNRNYRGNTVNFSRY